LTLQRLRRSGVGLGSVPARFMFVDLRAHQRALQLLQGLPLGLGEEEADRNQLHDRGRGKEEEWRSRTEPGCDDQESEKDRRVERGKAGIAHSLPLGAHRIGKYLADVNKNHQPLRECEERDEPDKEWQQSCMVSAGIEDPCHSEEADRVSDRSDDQQALAALDEAAAISQRTKAQNEQCNRDAHDLHRL
jgi:hypothetical protein